jgi:hypothetical protein
MMKFNSYPILLSILLLGSCREEVDLFTGSPAVPVVYCIIDPLDSVYRVQLTKTFYGERSAQELAQDPDMVVLRNAMVTLEAWKQGYRIWKTDFQSVNYGRDSGFFSSSPGCAFITRGVLNRSIGYQLSESFEPVFDYFRLVVSYENGNEPAIARIQASTGKPRIEFPRNNGGFVNLYDSIPYYVEFHYSERIYYDLRFKIRYLEQTDTWVERIHEFSYRRNPLAQKGLFRQEINPARFFKQLAENFPDSTGIISRKFVSLDFELYAGSPSLKTYVDTYNSESDHGHELWNCFNNGIGLFALKSHSSITDLIMEQTTLDSLALGTATKALKFSRWR